MVIKSKKPATMETTNFGRERVSGYEKEKEKSKKMVREEENGNRRKFINYFDILFIYCKYYLAVKCVSSVSG